MMLPGVIATTREDRRNDQGLWDFVQGTIVKAIENLNLMRATEGGRMALTDGALRPHRPYRTAY